MGQDFLHDFTGLTIILSSWLTIILSHYLNRDDASISRSFLPEYFAS